MSEENDATWNYSNGPSEKERKALIRLDIIRLVVENTNRDAPGDKLVKLAQLFAKFVFSGEQ